MKTITAPALHRMCSISIVAMLSLVMVCLNGCGDDGSNPDVKPARVRLLHFGYDVQALDMRMNGELVASNVTYGNSSGYKEIVPGQDTVSVHYAGSTLQRFSSIKTVYAENDYTVYAFPPAAAFSASMADDPRQIPPGRARIKFVNACDDASDNPADDIGLVAVHQTGSNTAFLGPELPTGITTYAEVASGKFAFTLVRPNVAGWMMDLDTVNLASSGVYTMVIHGTINPTDAYPFRISLYSDNGPGTEYVDVQQAPATGKLLFVHAVVNAPPVSIAFDGGAPSINALAYGSASSYQTFAAGAHTATVSVSSSGTAVLTGTPFTIENRKSYSVFASGSLVPPDVAPIVLTDDLSPSFSEAKIRFVHAASSTPSIDVKGTRTTGGDFNLPEMQGIGYRQTSTISSKSGTAFVPISATGTYTLRFMQAGTQEELATQTDITFLPGKIYTLWLGGSDLNSTLKAYVITHNP